MQHVSEIMIIAHSLAYIYMADQTHSLTWNLIQDTS